MTRALVTRGAAVFAAVFTLGVIGKGALAIVAATLGIIGVTLGVVIARRLPVTIGAVCLFAAVIFAGGEDLSPILLVAGAVAAVVAWDFGQTGVEMPTEFDPDAETTTLEVSHAAGTVVLVGASGGAVILLSRLSLPNLPPIAPLLFLFGGIMLAISVR